MTERNTLQAKIDMMEKEKQQNEEGRYVSVDQFTKLQNDLSGLIHEFDVKEQQQQKEKGKYVDEKRHIWGAVSANAWKILLVVKHLLALEKEWKRTMALPDLRGGKRNVGTSRKLNYLLSQFSSEGVVKEHPSMDEEEEEGGEEHPSMDEEEQKGGEEHPSMDEEEQEGIDEHQAMDEEQQRGVEEHQKIVEEQQRGVEEHQKIVEEQQRGVEEHQSIDAEQQRGVDKHQSIVKEQQRGVDKRNVVKKTEKKRRVPTWLKAQPALFIGELPAKYSEKNWSEGGPTLHEYTGDVLSCLGSNEWVDDDAISMYLLYLLDHYKFGCNTCGDAGFKCNCGDELWGVITPTALQKYQLASLGDNSEVHGREVWGRRKQRGREWDLPVRVARRIEDGLDEPRRIVYFGVANTNLKKTRELQYIGNHWVGTIFIKQRNNSPNIYILDTLVGRSCRIGNQRIAEILKTDKIMREAIRPLLEYVRYGDGTNALALTDVNVYRMQCPQQTTFNDCGIMALCGVERIMKNRGNLMYADDWQYSSGGVEFARRWIHWICTTAAHAQVSDAALAKFAARIGDGLEQGLKDMSLEEEKTHSELRGDGVKEPDQEAEAQAKKCGDGVKEPDQEEEAQAKKYGVKEPDQEEEAQAKKCGDGVKEPDQEEEAQAKKRGDDEKEKESRRKRPTDRSMLLRDYHRFRGSKPTPPKSERRGRGQPKKPIKKKQ
ncbi:hypothetical protein niasHS_005039 [Heterodera schachtii]|uniref:Ubiquitin-like protease family profile domain-containing protein n=1 Tax=Heterodera schachtii TaxID=97005 RepID=A0ABD2JKE6_HETSC